MEDGGSLDPDAAGKDAFADAVGREHRHGRGAPAFAAACVRLQISQPGRRYPDPRGISRASANRQYRSLNQDGRSTVRRLLAGLR